jgi:hypothetical protein
MKTIQSIVVLTFMICNAITAQRLELNKDITISQPVYENIYAAVNTMTVNAPIHGDLVIVGGTININDTVFNDIMLAGGTVIFNGYAGDDIRCAGGTLNVKKDIKGDLVITGGTVIIDKNVTIGGNLLVSGGDVQMNGTVKGSVRGAIADFEMNGIIEKNLDCRGGDLKINGTVKGQSALSAPDIVIGDNAAFLGDVRYWNTQGFLKFGESVKSGIAIYDGNLRIDTGRWYYVGFASVMAVLWYLGSVILMIFLAQYLFSNTLKRASATAQTESMKSLGYGFLYLLGVPTIMILTFVSIIGIPIGMILLFGYVMSLILATVITSVVVTYGLNTYYNKDWGAWQMLLVATGVFIVLKILSMIPIIGWIIMFVATLIVFGAILLDINWRRKQPRTIISPSTSTTSNPLVDVVI